MLLMKWEEKAAVFWRKAELKGEEEVWTVARESGRKTVALS